MHNKMVQKLLIALPVIAALVVLPACVKPDGRAGRISPPASSVSAYPDAGDGQKTVTIGVTYAPSSINPLAPVGPVSAYIAGLLFPPLVEFDSDLRYKPMLADSIATPDNRTFTIKLDPYAKWTDGTPVTAGDVVFTLKLMADPKVDSNLAYLFAILEGLGPSGHLPDGETDISGVREIDDHTVEMRTKAPTTLTVFEDTIGRNLRTLPRSALAGIAPEDLAESGFMRMPAPTFGPFKLAGYDPDRFAQLTANKNYFKGAPKLDRLNFKVLPDADVAAQLKSGEIDMNIPSAGVIPTADYDAVQGLPDVETFVGQPIATPYLYINEETMPDVRQRVALSRALDRRLLVDMVLGGAGEVVDGFFNSLSPYRNEEVPTVSYAPDVARLLFKRSGWNAGKTIELSVPSGDDTLRQAARVVAENLKAVGVKVEVRAYDTETLVDKLVRQDYDLGLMPESLSPVNPLPDLLYFLGAGNPNGYKNEKTSELLAAIGAEVDDAKVAELYDRLQVILSEDVPMPALYAAKALGAVNKRVVGATPKDFGMFIDVQDWDVR